MTSARGFSFEKRPNDLDLISRDQGWCMAAIFYVVRRRMTVSAQHACENVFRKKVGLLASDNQDGNVDSIPVFPEVHAVVPGIAERMCNFRVAQ